MAGAPPSARAPPAPPVAGAASAALDGSAAGDTCVGGRAQGGVTGGFGISGAACGDSAQGEDDLNGCPDEAAGPSGGLPLPSSASRRAANSASCEGREPFGR
mmetsp:Transcript_90078/g.291033  ORF Transcript_90078/g.291033 Transcript_90078/m.291033 type:complete len:102 (-) Transcript_90078:275-580(-)